MVAVRKDYAAPTGLEIVLVLGSTKMPRLRRWGLGEMPSRGSAGRRPGEGFSFWVVVGQ
jgi:hypothetical protein